MRAGLLFLLGCMSVFNVFSGQLKHIHITQQGQKTSLFITIEGSFTHKLFTLANPERVVLDLSNTRLAVNLIQLKLKTALISNARSGKPDPATLRLVFDVSEKVRVSSVPWETKGIRIDFLVGANNSSHVPLAKPFQAKTSPALEYKQSNSQNTLRHATPVRVSNSPSNKYLRDVVVILDAGHGGKDPGAKGPGDSKEKNVVLAITLKLKQLIDKQIGMRAVLTRSGDYYVGLRQRLDIARKYNGDIFVSIHADAFNNPHSNGASVFALSQSGATSEAARWLAEKENYSELGGVNLGELDDTNGVVRSVLIDLSQTATINSGIQMGARVLSQLNNFTALHNSKVEQAGFMVLKSTDIPSILVETGFISNPREERNLTNNAYQLRLSQAIFQGIKEHFWDNPPHGTRIEAMTSNHVHIVRSGDSLPAIALRYHVTVQALRAMNGLSSFSAIKSGQKLVIPSAWL